LQTSKGGKPLKAKKTTPSVDFDLAGTSTKVNVHTDKSVDMHTNVQIAQGTMPSSSVIINNSHLYSLGSCPICAHEVEKSLSFYPFFGNPDLVREKIFKEIDLDRVAGPFDYPPMPTFMVFPIFLVRKKNGDLRLIHNLSYPTHNSVNDFIDPEFCTVRYPSIDDAIDMINRIGKGGSWQKLTLRVHFDYSESPHLTSTN
jgi:hypothetical protein